MKPEPTRKRIRMALKLKPMTCVELGKVLSLDIWTIRKNLALMDVPRTGLHSTKGRPFIIYGAMK
jgi:hypothetical protein